MAHEICSLLNRVARPEKMVMAHLKISFASSRELANTVVAVERTTFRDLDEREGIPGRRLPASSLVTAYIISVEHDCLSWDDQFMEDVQFLPGVGWTRPATAVEMEKRMWLEHLIKHCDHQWVAVREGQRDDGTPVLLCRCNYCEVYMVAVDPMVDDP